MSSSFRETQATVTSHNLTVRYLPDAFTKFLYTTFAFHRSAWQADFRALCEERKVRPFVCLLFISFGRYSGVERILFLSSSVSPFLLFLSCLQSLLPVSSLATKFFRLSIILFLLYIIIPISLPPCILLVDRITPVSLFLSWFFLRLFRMISNFYSV